MAAVYYQKFILFVTFSKDQMYSCTRLFFWPSTEYINLRVRVPTEYLGFRVRVRILKKWYSSCTRVRVLYSSTPTLLRSGFDSLNVVINNIVKCEYQCFIRLRFEFESIGWLALTTNIFFRLSRGIARMARPDQAAGVDRRQRATHRSFAEQHRSAWRFNGVACGKSGGPGRKPRLRCRYMWKSPHFHFLSQPR